MIKLDGLDLKVGQFKGSPETHEFCCQIGHPERALSFVANFRHIFYTKRFEYSPGPSQIKGPCWAEIVHVM